MRKWLCKQVPLYVALLAFLFGSIVLPGFGIGLTMLGVSMVFQSDSSTEFVFVAGLTDDCKDYAPPKRLIAVPLSFSVSPIEAAKALPRCWKKMSTTVYADKENYYFYGSLLALKVNDEWLRTHAYVVSGKTGNLLASPAQ